MKCDSEWNRKIKENGVQKPFAEYLDEFPWNPGLKKQRKPHPYGKNGLHNLRLAGPGSEVQSEVSIKT